MYLTLLLANLSQLSYKVFMCYFGIVWPRIVKGILHEQQVVLLYFLFDEKVARIFFSQSCGVVIQNQRK